MLSTPYHQYDQDNQENGAKAAADVRPTVVETTPAKQDQKNNDENYQVHSAHPPGNDYAAEAIITKVM
jgi:hypothetical protein